MSDETKQKLLTEKDLNAKEKDFLKVFNFAYDRGFRRVVHPFGALMQKGSIAFNMQAIYVWSCQPKGKSVVCNWVKILDYKGNYDEFIKKIQERDK